MNLIFDADDIKGMIEHWMRTPPNGYIGVSYGRNPRELLNRPMDEDIADTYLSWMREDIPVLKQLSSGDLSIVSENVGHDRKNFFISIGNTILIPIQSDVEETVVGV